MAVRDHRDIPYDVPASRPAWVKWHHIILVIRLSLRFQRGSRNDQITADTTMIPRKYNGDNGDSDDDRSKSFHHAPIVITPLPGAAPPGDAGRRLLFGPRETGQEVDPLRHLRRAQPGAGVGLEFVFAYPVSGPEHDGGIDFFAVLLIGDGDRQGILDAGIRLQDLVDGCR